MARTQLTDKICAECWNRAIDCYGTGKIFIERANRYRKLLDFISYLGIAVPALVGGIVLAYGAHASYLPLIFFAAGLLGLAQLLLSIASVVRSWPSELEYAHESASANFFLSEEFKRLGSTATSPSPDLQAKSNELIAKDEARRQQDIKKTVTDKELRKGHRHGLRYFQRACVECKQVPRDIISTDCNVCGRF
ncbi:mobilome CxxCx(11)CxxC protein [Dyella sp. KRB-257]|uniref:mobilome CxxCx(11)CxxC protein n=1 Tax=Dyella sp. KRB-257 TaxID=3400915 RepID=UPI003C0F032C